MDIEDLIDTRNYLVVLLLMGELNQSETKRLVDLISLIEGELE